MKPVIVINVVTPKKGKMDELIELQKKGQRKFAHIPDGWIGGRLHVSQDRKRMVVMIVFETVAQHQAWMQNPEFQKFREDVLAIVEKIEPGYFEAVGEEGQLQNWDF